MLFTGVRFFFSLFAIFGLIAPFVAGTPAEPIEERGIIDTLTSDAVSVGGDFTKAIEGLTTLAPDVVATIVSVGNQVVTVVTDEGGKALTLVQSGVITSVAGHEFTIATSAIASATSNAASSSNGASPFALPCAGLWSMMLGALFGAVFTLA
ncbi:hypothetical protein VKT23_017616 [Stygiomarasmius scandens]|uniref:Uncharacterized protein n=1 Tax=Marasmiellus scandens TaxID=2682957 RepID=A0ABR1IRZ5_9AGAR